MLVHVENPITGMLMSDEGEIVPANLVQWLYSVTKREVSREAHPEDLV